MGSIHRHQRLVDGTHPFVAPLEAGDLPVAGLDHHPFAVLALRRDGVPSIRILPRTRRSTPFAPDDYGPGEDVVVGVNRFTTTEPNPLTADLTTAIQSIDPAMEKRAVDAVRQWRAGRDERAVTAALAELKRLAATSENLVPATLGCARAGVTTGEWAGALREVFGEYREPVSV